MWTVESGYFQMRQSSDIGSSLFRVKYGTKLYRRITFVSSAHALLTKASKYPDSSRIRWSG